jgi:hypothetical protein
MLHTDERREATEFGFRRRPIERWFVLREKSYLAAEGKHTFHDRVETATHEPSLPPARTLGLDRPPPATEFLQKKSALQIAIFPWNSVRLTPNSPHRTSLPATSASAPPRSPPPSRLRSFLRRQRWSGSTCVIPRAGSKPISKLILTGILPQDTRGMGGSTGQRVLSPCSSRSIPAIAPILHILNVAAIIAAVAALLVVLDVTAVPSRRLIGLAITWPSWLHSWRTRPISWRTRPISWRTGPISWRTRLISWRRDGSVRTGDNRDWKRRRRSRLRLNRRIIDQCTLLIAVDCASRNLAGLINVGIEI